MTAAELLPLLYEELKRQAHLRLLRFPHEEALRATALVHEAYLRLTERGDRGWINERHFFAAAACAMRDVLVEQSRQRQSLKHGGAHGRVSLQDALTSVEPPLDSVLEIDVAIRKLERSDPRAAQLVMLRFFAGLTMEKAAANLGISDRTARREWAYARAWLRRELGQSDGGEDSVDG